MLDGVTVRIQHADGRNLPEGQPLLPPGFPQQVGRSKDRWLRVALVAQDGSHIRRVGAARVLFHAVSSPRGLDDSRIPAPSLAGGAVSPTGLAAIDPPYRPSACRAVRVAAKSVRYSTSCRRCSRSSTSSTSKVVSTHPTASPARSVRAMTSSSSVPVLIKVPLSTSHGPWPLIPIR